MKTQDVQQRVRRWVYLTLQATYETSFLLNRVQSDYSICNPRAFEQIADLFAKFEKVIDEIDNFEDEVQYQGDNRESESQVS